jgi:O-antigen/teichoic acid export membrane protein
MEKSIRYRILKNTSVNTIGKFLSFLFQLFIVAYLIKTLGKEAYGLVVLALALVANTNLLEAGFGLSVTKYVAEHRARGEQEELLKVVNTNLAVATAIGVVLALIVILINEVFLGRIFNIPQELLPDAKALIRLLIPMMFVDLWTVSIIRVAEGLQKFALARAMEFVKWSSRVLLVVLFVSAGYGLRGVGAGFLIAGVICLFVAYFGVIVREHGMRLSIGFMDIESFKKLLGFSVWVFLSKVFAFLSYRIDTIIIGIFLSPVYLTYYNVAFKIYETLQYVLSLASSTLVPVASELGAVMDSKKLSALVDRGTRYSTALILPAAIGVFIYMERIIELWVGEGFETSALLGRLFIVALMAIAPVAIGGVVMIGVNRLKVLVKFNAVATAVNLALSLYLVQTVGVQGVVIGTVVGSFIILVTYKPTIAKELGTDLGRLIKASMLPVPMGGLFLLFILLIPGYPGIVAGAIAYLVTAVFLVLHKDDRAALAKALSRAG